MFLLKVYIAIPKFDIICISETYLDSSTPFVQFRNFWVHLSLSRPPCQQKRGGVSILYKSFLPLRILNVQYLQGSIFFELKIAEKAWNFFSLYRSPSQIQDDFEAFTENLELNLENGAKNPFLVVSTRDFNAKSTNWFCHNNANFEGDAIEN